MSEVAKRLQDTSELCLKAYTEWSGDKTDKETRRSLQETLHELRKVASRVEIEMAISERDDMAKNPIPVPHHRSKRGGDNNKKPEKSQDVENDNGQGGTVVEKKTLKKRTPRKRASE